MKRFHLAEYAYDFEATVSAAQDASLDDEGRESVIVCRKADVAPFRDALEAADGETIVQPYTYKGETMAHQEWRIRLEVRD